MQHNCKHNATTSASFEKSAIRVQLECNSIAIRMQFECNVRKECNSSAIRLQFVCNSSAQILQCNKIKKNDCKHNANKSANIAQYILALGEVTKERNTCARTFTNSAINNGAGELTKECNTSANIVHFDCNSIAIRMQVECNKECNSNAIRVQ
jgi:hypothetical protein